MKMIITVDAAAMEADIKRRIQAMPDKTRMVLERMGVRMLRSTAMNFQRSGRLDSTGGMWAPLSAATIAMRKKGQRRSPKRLVASGRLKNSITPNVRGATLEIGTNVEYAKYHQQNGVFGESIPIKVFGKASAKLDASPFLVFHKQDLKWLNRQVKREFGRGG